MAAPKISGLGYYKGMNISGLGAFPSSATAGSGLSGAPVHDGTVITDKLKVGSTSLDEVRHGSTYVHTVYKGDTVVWHKPELALPSDVILYVPLNETSGTSLSNIKAYTSDAGSTVAVENTGWFSISGSGRGFATAVDTSPVGHSTVFDINGSSQDGQFTTPSSWLSNMQNLTTNITLEYFFLVKSGTAFTSSWSQYHLQGGWSQTAYGWNMENYSSNTSGRPAFYIEYGYQSAREGHVTGYLTDNKWYHLIQGVQMSDGKFFQYLTRVDNGNNHYADRGTRSNFTSWSPTNNLSFANNNWNLGQMSEIRIRVNRSDWGSIYNANSITPPTTPLIS